jgi:hypothetical protein
MSQPLRFYQLPDLRLIGPGYYHLLDQKKNCDIEKLAIFSQKLNLEILVKFSLIIIINPKISQFRVKKQQNLSQIKKICIIGCLVTSNSRI